MVDSQHNPPVLAMSELPRKTSPMSTGGATPIGIYVHVPFCASTCDFCAFYQTSPTAEGVRDYLAGIAAEAALVTRPRAVTTMFWGGGTPGLLAPRQIVELGGILREWCGGVAPAEWSVEMAPASVTEARLEALREVGVTRISMGAQSFQPALLDGLGRQHTREQVFRAYDRIRAADFASVNIDLMFALPGQDEAAWRSDLDQAIALAPDHISTYCLTFEEDTALWVKLAQGKVKLDPDHEAQLYLATWRRLAEAGYAQYEVSNFARAGHACHHNLNTWQMHEWVGFGPSAASQFDGWRASNPADLVQWSREVGEGVRATTERTRLTPELLGEDRLVFGLRTNAGVDLREVADRFPEYRLAAVEPELDRLEAEGLLRREGSCIELTDEGRLVADAVGLVIMEATES